MSAPDICIDSGSPLISIIIPVYNVAACLDGCLDSVVRQSYSNLEVFLIDDCSDDGSGEICDTFARKDSRFRVFHSARHSGPSACRNLGLEAASGSLIGFVDSDDRIDPDMYEKMIRCMQKEKADAVICDFTEEREDSASGQVRTVPRTEDFETCCGREVSRMILCRNLSDYSWNKLLKKELLGGVRYPEGVVYEDVCTVFRFFIRSEKTAHLKEPLYTYIRRKNSITCRFNIKKERDFNNALLCKLEYCEENEPDLLPDQFSNLFLSMLTFSNTAAKTGNLAFFLSDPSVQHILNKLRSSREAVLSSYRGKFAKLKFYLLTSEKPYAHRLLAFLYSAGGSKKRS